MSLLDDLKRRAAEADEWLARNEEHLKRSQDLRAEKIEEVAQINIAIAALEAHQAPSHHPTSDAMRSVPGAEEEVRDQSETEEEAHARFELFDQQTVEPVNPNPEPELPASTFEGQAERLEPVDLDLWQQGYNDMPTSEDVVLEVYTRDGTLYTGLAGHLEWGDAGAGATIIAYRVLSQAVETDQPEVPDVEETLPGDPLPGFDEADAESDALGDGWIHWTGGDCPVDQSAVVEYRLRGADSPPRDPKPAFLLRWDHAGVLGDIIAYRVVSQPADQHEDPTAVAIAAYIEAENPEPTSVLDDPDFQAAVDRANASIAQDEPRAEYDRALPNGFVAWGGVSLDPSGRPEDVGPDFTVDVIYRDGERPFRLTGAIASALSWDHMSESRSSDIIAYRVIEESPQPYVGCIDEELERDYDAAKARTTIQPDAEKKTFFAFLGAKPKPEEVC